MGLCLDLCYLFWGKFRFKIIFLNWFYLEFLVDNSFLNLKKKFFLCFVVELSISICSTFTHSFTHFHTFFSCIWGSVSVGRCAFLFLGIDTQLINCVWKIRVALRRASWCELCRLIC